MMNAPSFEQLQELAARQQHQLHQQQQVVVAKEQRLKYLKQQDLRRQQAAAAAGDVVELDGMLRRVAAQEERLCEMRRARGEEVNQNGFNFNSSSKCFFLYWVYYHWSSMNM